ASRTSRRRRGRTRSGRRGCRPARPAGSRSRTGGLRTCFPPRAPLSSGFCPACYTGAVSETPTTEAGGTRPQGHGHGLAYALVAVFLAALAYGAWARPATFGPRPYDAPATTHPQPQRFAGLTKKV